ncbi:MAG: dusA [Gammaproteobacteria bacterium]|nr:dusA [Gammaproteobacteria bacterium]
MNRLISVAPMMDCTDKHDRYFLRLIAPHVLLYTEMVTVNALIHGNHEYLLAFDPLEHPIALQLGGSEPKKLEYCTKLGVEYGYDEINLNVGCPSDRVKSGQFGACLMLNPSLVAECISAMRAIATVPVTVKCRIGVDDQDSYEALQKFIAVIAKAGCEIFIIHARKAWLNGLSPKQNREIPPLRYDIVRRVKKDFPELTIIVNGGITSCSEISEHLQFLDGVMIGREAYANPYFLAEIEENYFPFERTDLTTRYTIMEKFIPYVESQLQNKVRLSSITRHILGLFQGQKGARAWRRYLSEHAHQEGAGIEILKEGLQYVRNTQINL